MTKQEGVHPEPVCDAAPASGLRGGEAEPSAALNPCHPDNVSMGVPGGYIGHTLARRVQNALLTDGWIASVANAYEVGVQTQLAAARKITPDTWHRRQRIKRHQSQAHYEALHVAALRELLRFRQALAKATPSSLTQVMDRDTGGGGE